MPVVVLGGEQMPDAELMELSTVPMGVATEAHAYLAQGGPDNLAQLHRFLSDTVLLTGEGFEPPAVAPDWGVLDRADRPATGPRVAVLYYRAHHLAGNTAFVDALCAAVEDAGGRAAAGLHARRCARSTPELLDALRTADALVVTVLAAGGSRPATAAGRGDDGAWDVGALAALDVPVLQGLCLTTPRARRGRPTTTGSRRSTSATRWPSPSSTAGSSRVPFSFKEIDDDGPDRLRRRPRAGRPGRRHRRRARPAPAHRRRPSGGSSLMLSALPDQALPGSATPSAWTPRRRCVRLLAALRGRGLRHRPVRRPGALPGVADLDGDALVHALIAAGGQDPDWLTDEQLAGQPGPHPGRRVPRLLRHPARRTCATAMVEHWGPPPGELFVDPTGRRHRASPRCAAGNVVVMVQPPRGFGENPIAIYHDPDLPPSHHYLAAYHWWLRPSGSARTPSCTSASTATWSGCPARPSGCRRRARRTPRSATCR